MKVITAKVRFVILFSANEFRLLSSFPLLLPCFDNGDQLTLMRNTMYNLHTAWADAGECNANPRYMMVYCVKSCNVCHYKGDLAELIQTRLDAKAEEDEEKAKLDKTKYGVEQVLSDDKTKKAYNEMIDYIENVVMVEEKYKNIREDCKLRSENCAFWAATGQCEETRDYMITQCAPVCKTCELLDFEMRCPYDPDEETALKPGDLNKLFEKLITLKEYAPNILSMPNSTSPDVFDGPWVVTLDNFLTEEECDRLIQLGNGEGYLESADVGNKKWDGKY
jgi:prolyl 4-hydroxylase